MRFCLVDRNKQKWKLFSYPFPPFFFLLMSYTKKYLLQRSSIKRWRRFLGPTGLLYKIWLLNYFLNDELHIILKPINLKIGEHSSFFNRRKYNFVNNWKKSTAPQFLNS